MTLRSAVKGCVAAREKAAGTAGVLLTMVAREAGKEPASFDLRDLDAAKRMAEEIRAVEAKGAPRTGGSVEVWDDEGRHLHTILSTCGGESAG